MSIAVRLPHDMEQRLAFLADKTGRKKSFYVREALVNYLDDLEDVYLAENVLEHVRSGKEEVLNSKDFWNDLES